MADKKGEQSDRDEIGRFKPGHALGGPGRPPNDQSLTHMTREELFREQELPLDPREPEGEKELTSYAKRFIAAQIKKGIAGDPTASAHIWNRIEGKVVQPIQVDPALPIDAPLLVMVSGERIDVSDADDPTD